MLDFGALNPAQARAVQHHGGHALVLASPGSGKTFLIVNRLRYLIENCQVPPETILVITFTKAAALSMQRRFIEVMERKILPVRFGTFHAVFYQILREFTGYNDQAVLTTKEKIWYIQNLLGEKEYLAEKLYPIFNIIKNNKKVGLERYLPEEISPKEFCTLYESYSEALKRDGKLDFEDMAPLCIRLLQENHEVRRKLQERYRYILIDEYQDTNLQQDQVVRLLAGNRGQVFVVGDEDQAIYGFRGSTPDMMQSFSDRYGSVKRYELTQNYRSTGNIVDASMKVIGENKNRFPKQVKSQKEKGELVLVKGFETRERMYHHICDRIRELRQELPYEEMAVIFRTNRQVEGAAQALDRAGIPYYAGERAVSMYEHILLLQLQECMAYVAGKNPYGAALWRKLKGREKDRQMLAPLAPRAVIRFLRGALGWDRLLKEKALEEYQGDPKQGLLLWQEWESLLEETELASRACKSIPVWLAYMEEKKESWKKPNQSRAGVQLMTMHGSKGLEFTYVCLPEINEGILPGRRSTGESAIEEERRLFYVAMTRAKKILDILYLTGTKEYPRFPSRFVNPLLKNHSSSTSSSNSTLSKNSS